MNPLLGLALVLLSGTVLFGIGAYIAVDALFPCLPAELRLAREDLEALHSRHGALMRQAGYEQPEFLGRFALDYYTHALPLAGVLDMLSKVSTLRTVVRSTGYFRASAEACCNAARDLEAEKLAEKMEIEGDQGTLILLKEELEMGLEALKAKQKALEDELAMRLSELDEAEKQEIEELRDAWRESRELESRLIDEWGACSRACDNPGCMEECDDEYIPLIEEQMGIQWELEAEKAGVMERYAEERRRVEDSYGLEIKAIGEEIARLEERLREIDGTLAWMAERLPELSRAIEVSGELMALYCE
jgi:predicted nuclease with TOPRIM domain